MRQKEISLNIQPEPDEFGDDHHGSSAADTPLRPDAFEMDDEVKIEKIEKHFREIMHILGLDLNDDSLNGTPRRVAKMFVKEVFSGLNPKNRPHARLFENKYNYDQMLVEKDITFYSHCEHHFVPIYGKAHVAYFSSGKVIGLSKINRIVQYFSKRPQVQERLTVQIGKELERILQTEDVGVVLDANHMCVASRGVGDTNSKTGTAYFSGKFKDENIKREFLNYINSK
ncbi:GTP cyclohydrolase I FolE [Pseudochryseolinea flava]|uniref:GTP cyclohydrolase 1 n=1 Tax=Pseudochryseolinea flava TaxID=2059302 RepID=A0A364Y3K8_9BACT|nr:GTP cyclohydrolase I FolE [Pseudochryseolinea flava]RAW01465.1 GTP cyclohydrolase I FolE [Pseudochryseolinea flava]